MKEFTILEVVEKLIGNTKAIGESNYDEKANKNIKVLGTLTRDLVLKLIQIKNDNLYRHEYSVKENGKLASIFLKDIKEWLDE